MQSIDLRVLKGENYLYIHYNKNYTERARKLRKNMTQEERKLWYTFLKYNKHRFLRQKVIDNYIVDFYCPSKKLILEIDGGQHYTTDGMQYDEVRTDVLEKYNLKVLRINNYEINYKFKEACELIDYELNKEPSVT